MNIALMISKLEIYMHILFFIITAIVIKLSILGLGVISILVSVLAILLLRFTACRIPNNLERRFAKKFKIALLAHISVYALFIAKLVFVDNLQDLPAFIASHLIVHHIASGLIAATLVFMSIKTYNQIKTINIKSN